MRLFITLTLAFIALSSSAQRKTGLETDWKFHRGSLVSHELIMNDESQWQSITLPHDFSIEPAMPVPDKRQRAADWNNVQVGPFARLNLGNEDQGQTIGGEGWYMKSFSLPVNNNESLDSFLANNEVSIKFDGVYNSAEVWINNVKSAINLHGYMPFSVNINRVLANKDNRNSNNEKQVTVVVRALNADHNSRWYSGSGIYRHVWLITTPKIHLNEYDTFVDGSNVHPKNGANIKVSAKVFNESTTPTGGELVVSIFDKDGNKVATSTKAFASANANGSMVNLEVNVKKPHLWSTENPYRYTANISVVANGREQDALNIPFGIRTISFSAEEGFKLNGKPLNLKGGCAHHDNGLLGAAAIDRAEIRKAELLKAQGFNAVRCSHNLPSETFLYACDSLGLLVIDEVFDQWEVSKRPNDYSTIFSKEKVQLVNGHITGLGISNFEYDAALMVRRDRNHPSIIIWSIGNEIYQRSDATRGQELAKIICKVIKSEDTTRPTTMANCTYWDQPGKSWEVDSPIAFENIEIGGYNYAAQYYEADHEKFPNRIMVGTESYPNGIAEYWNLVEKHPYVIGDFVWTAVDYIGEAGVGHTFERTDDAWVQTLGWPWFNAWCGDIDLIGDKKMQSYYRDIVWGRRKIAMAVRPAIPVGEHEEVRGWCWTAEENHWNWGKGIANAEIWSNASERYLPLELRPENYNTEGIAGYVKHDINAPRPDSLRVNVYSREKRVRLSINGRIIGEQNTNPNNYTASFMVAYEPGEIKAEVVSKGSPATVSYSTASVPAAIRIDAVKSSISASHNDLAYIYVSIVDDKGNLCPTAQLPVSIETSGTKHIATAGTAHPYDMKSFRSLTPTTYRGRALIIIQPQDVSGQVSVRVNAPGLKSAEQEIILK